MGNKKVLLLLLLSFAILLSGAYILYSQLGEEAAPDLLATQDAPTQNQTQTDAITAQDFTVYDKDGNSVRLSDFFGKPIVLNFWASWCGPCKREMPDFHEKYLSLGEDVQFLMINMTDGSRETVQTALSFVTAQQYTFPVYYDTSSEAAVAYGTYSLPTTYFIDNQGRAIAQATGAIDSETLQKGIDMILPKP